MALEYRAPKAVQEEASANQGQHCLRISSPLSIEDVKEIRNSWVGAAGIAWANKITADITSRADLLTKGEPMIDTTSVDMEALMAKVNAIDALVDELMDCLCIPDESPTTQITAGEIAPTRNAEESPMIEERKSAIATAERITMTAEVRSIATDDGSLKIAGYAATFNSEASGLKFREQIAPGAFTRTLQSDNSVFLLVNHDTDSLPLASTSSGTLRLSQDDIGLRMEADLDPANPFSAALASALHRGDVDKMSFSFTVAPGGESRDAGLRTLTDLNLFEVSIVTWPAYDSTSASMRSAQESELQALELRRTQLKLTLKLNSLKK